MISLGSFETWLKSDSSLNFDIYAQNPDEWIWLRKIIPNLVVSSAGGSCPFQAEGLLYGLPFYYRERNGWASLSVGESNGAPPYLDSIYSAGIDCAEFSDEEEFARLMIV